SETCAHPRAGPLFYRTYTGRHGLADLPWSPLTRAPGGPAFWVNCQTTEPEHGYGFGGPSVCHSPHNRPASHYPDHPTPARRWRVTAGMDPGAQRLSARTAFNAVEPAT